MKKIKEIKGKVITVNVEDKKIEELDTLAKKMGLNRSQLIRNMIDTELDNLKFMQSTGILTMALKGFDLFEILKKSVRNKTYKIEDDQRVIIELNQ